MKLFQVNEGLIAFYSRLVIIKVPLKCLKLSVFLMLTFQQFEKPDSTIRLTIKFSSPLLHSPPF